MLCVSSGFIISLIRIKQGYSSFLSFYIKKLNCFKKIQDNKSSLNKEEDLNRDLNAQNDCAMNDKLSENLTNGNADRVDTASDFINLERNILQNVIRILIKKKSKNDFYLK